MFSVKGNHTGVKIQLKQFGIIIFINGAENTKF